MSDHAPQDRSPLLAHLLPRAIQRRQPLVAQHPQGAVRIFSGLADGIDGVFLDTYSDGAVLIVYEGRAPRNFDPQLEAAAAIELLRPLGVRAIYLKPFARDRSKLGGELPPVTTEPTPLVGDSLPEFILIREHAWQLEVRLYDGLSTGLFLDQRDNRKFVFDHVTDRTRNKRPTSVLNTFAYTCAFSVAAAMAGASTTSVDVSPRYLDWGRRNFEHNSLAITDQQRFARMDTFEFFAYARRKNLKYDLIVLDPPSFSAGSKKKGIRPWSSVEDYARLVEEAAGLLNRGGVIFASTNTQELCRGDRLDREIARGLRRTPKWIDLPASPIDFARDKDRFAARAFSID